MELDHPLGDFTGLDAQEVAQNHITRYDMSKLVKSTNITNNFTAVLVHDDGKWVAQCKEIPYIYGQGDDKKNAVHSLLEGISDELDISVNSISLNLEIDYEN